MRHSHSLKYRIKWDYNKEKKELYHLQAFCREEDAALTAAGRRGNEDKSECGLVFLQKSQ